MLSFSSGYDKILVIVNQLSKQTIFFPIVDTITSYKLAQLFVIHIFSKHSVPSHVTSNCEFEFVSNFFQSLGATLDMRLHFTSGYHPKGNSQTEYTNQMLEQYLYVYCNRITGQIFFHLQNLCTTILSEMKMIDFNFILFSFSFLFSVELFSIFYF